MLELKDVTISYKNVPTVQHFNNRDRLFRW